MTESVYDQVHREYLERAGDPAWRMAMEIYLGELVGEIASYHQAHIQAVADQSALKQISKAKTQITKQFLYNRLEEIQKADKKDFNEGYWVREHGRFARWVGPNKETPKFTTGEGARVHPGSTAQDYHAVVRDELGRLSFTEQQKPHRVVGYLAKPVELPMDVSDAEHKADVLQRAAVMATDLENKTRDPRNKQRVQYLVTNPSGHSRILTPPAGSLPQAGKDRHQIDWEGGERVQYMTPVGPDNPVTVAGHALNVGHVMGANPENSAKLGSVAQDIHDTLTSTSWGKRLQAAANAARVVSDNSPITVQAHAVAQLANLIGPDAARAFGPKLRQLTYRYSGQEASREQWSEPAQAGRASGETTPAYENRLAQNLAESLPTRREYAASLQAGTTPPSRGFILNKDGKVVSEAVGFSDDWYTPFNLKKLPNLRGGSYVRSRGYGGITPEDLRLAMRTGAKRVTVVSNNGTFSMEFEPKALHWGHRFGFGGNAMIRRYTKSLDAIKNAKVEDPEGSVGAKLTLNSRGYEASMIDLKRKFPFWITDPRQNNIPYHRPFSGTNRPHEMQGDREDTEGYVAPLGIKAQGARAGYAEANHRELWTDAPSGKFSYDSVSRYQLKQNMADRVIRSLTGTESSGTTGGTARSTGGSYSTGSGTAANAGAVRTERAYPQDEKLPAGQMDTILMDVRRLMQQNEKIGAPARLNETSHLEGLYSVLMSDNFSQGDSDYKEWRTKLANNPDVRKELAEEIGDTYQDHRVQNSVTDLLPRLHSETAERDDEEQGAAAAAELYGADHMPSFASVDSSPAVKNYRNMLAIKAQEAEGKTDEQSAKDRTALNQMGFYLNRLREVERATRENRQPTALGEQQTKIFNAVNEQMVRVLNMERERAADPGDTGDSGERTWGSGVVTWNRALEQHVLNDKTEPEDAVQDIVVRVYDQNGNDNDKLFRTLDEWSAMFRRQATRLRRNGGAEHHAHKLDHIANLIDEQVEADQDASNLERRMNDPRS